MPKNRNPMAGLQWKINVNRLESDVFLQLVLVVVLDEWPWITKPFGFIF